MKLPHSLLPATGLVVLAAVALPLLPGLAGPGRRPLPGGNMSPAQFTQSLRDEAIRDAQKSREALGEQAEIRDAATHDQLAQLWKQAQREDPMKKLQRADGDDPSKENQPQDIIASSDIICFRGMATLVPKKAILAIPDNYRDRLELKPGAQIRTWADFYAANRGWITTVEVERIEAEGNSPLKKDTAKTVESATNLVVATFRGGPISVLPPKEPVSPDATPPGAAKPEPDRKGLTGKLVP